MHTYLKHIWMQCKRLKRWNPVQRVVSGGRRDLKSLWWMKMRLGPQLSRFRPETHFHSPTMTLRPADWHGRIHWNWLKRLLIIKIAYQLSASLSPPWDIFWFWNKNLKFKVTWKSVYPLQNLAYCIICCTNCQIFTQSERVTDDADKCSVNRTKRSTTQRVLEVSLEVQ